MIYIKSLKLFIYIDIYCSNIIFCATFYIITLTREIKTYYSVALHLNLYNNLPLISSV